jgi:hypothetical protein
MTQLFRHPLKKIEIRNQFVLISMKFLPAAVGASDQGADSMAIHRSLAAGLGLALSAALAGAAFAQPDTDAPDAGSAGAGRMIVLSDDALQRAESVTILRGSAIAPRQAPARSADRVQLLGGRQLWLVDHATGEVTACRARNTSTVGRRIIECTSGDLR